MGTLNGTKDNFIQVLFMGKQGNFDYFNSLEECDENISVLDRKLFLYDELLCKKCSFKVGKYLIYRKTLDEKKQRSRWTNSLIYVYNTKTDKLKQDLTGFIDYTLYALEQEENESTCSKTLIRNYSSLKVNLGIFRKYNELDDVIVNYQRCVFLSQWH